MAKLKPWYDVVELREDLRENRPLDASEFAIHLDQIRDGRAHKDYTDPQRFFDRTYVTGSLLDYCLPRAADLPPFHSFTDLSSPATTNMFGAKGAGECGVVGTPPAIVAAVVDALGEYGVRHLDMPICSEQVWRLISTGQAHSRIS